MAITLAELVYSELIGLVQRTRVSYPACFNKIRLTENMVDKRESYTKEDLLASGRGELFGANFIGDPVMPGCLGLDAMWQLVGFYLGWLGGEGKGRALGVGEVKFTGQVLPTAKKVTYRIHFKRIVNRRLIMGLADGEVLVDGRLIYTASDLKVGLFQDTSAF